MIDWRIYYGDGSTFSSADGPPEAAPAWGVVSVACRDSQDPREIHRMQGTGFDFFVWDGIEWWGVDQIGLIDRLADRTAKVVCFGRTIPTPAFQEITRRAVKDMLDG